MKRLVVSLVYHMSKKSSIVFAYNLDAGITEKMKQKIAVGFRNGKLEFFYRCFLYGWCAGLINVSEKIIIFFYL